jgi:hypothetical protein
LTGINKEEVLGRRFGRGLINNEGLRRLKTFEIVKSRDACQPHLLSKLSYASRAFFLENARILN